MDLLNLIAERELDQIIASEYGDIKPLLEKGGSDDDDALTTPFSRAFSFPARAIRYRKAKNIMIRYSRKILSKVEKIIRKFEGELDKSITQITEKGQDLQRQLDKAKKTGDEVEVRAVVNQQKKFKADVEKNQEARVQHLNQSIDNLIQAYTNGITKRIDEPGYVLKVELSDKGKADLKFLWEEYVSKIKQQTYEKLIKIINNKHVKGLEKLIARLEVEIEDAEDKRFKSRRSRENIFREEKKELEQKEREKMMGGKKKISREEEPEEDDNKPESKEPKAKEIPDETYEEIIKYLEEELPEGIIEEEPYRVSYKINGVPKYFDAYLEVDDSQKDIKVALYKKGDDPGEDASVKEFFINSKEEAETFEDAVAAGEEEREFEKADQLTEKYSEVISSYLEILFKTKKKRIEDAFNFEFYTSYKKESRIEEFSDYVAGEIVQNPEKYSKFLKLVKNESFTDQQLILLLLKFKEGFEATLTEGFVSFQKYNKL